METISTLCAFVVVAAMFITPVLLLVFLVRWVLKKPKKKIGIATLISAVCFVAFTLLGTATDPSTHCEHEYRLVTSEPATCTKEGFETYHCDLCSKDREDKLEELGHDMVDVRRVEPTYEVDGEFVRGCTRCEYEEITVLEKLPKPTETAPPTETMESQVTEPTEPLTTSESTEPIVTSPPPTEPKPTNPNEKFEEIYTAYKANELVADEKYQGKRCRITATIYAIESDGLLNLTGGATLTMQLKVGSTTVFLFAEFEKEQEDALKKVVVGDTITFEGTCHHWNTWADCEIVG